MDGRYHCADEAAGPLTLPTTLAAQGCLLRRHPVSLWAGFLLVVSGCT
jgi:hypothetical protein